MSTSSPSRESPSLPSSPSHRPSSSIQHDYPLPSAREVDYPPHDAFESDTDSSSRDSPISPASDRHLLYGHDTPSPDPYAQYAKEKKTPRRVYFDYGVITSHSDSQSPSPISAKFEASQHRFSGENTRYMVPSSSSLFPWELPSPVHARTTTPHATEKEARTETSSFFHSQPFWLVLYFAFNLGLTLYNKAMLIHFPYAYALTALHALCGSVGGFTLLRLGVYVPARLSNADNLALLAFSLLYTINIAVSNLSLELVTIPFHQVVRAVTPIFTVFLSWFLFGNWSSRQKLASLVPVVAGVGFATYGDYYFTTYGFLLTLLGTLLAAIKTIYTSILQSPPSSQTPLRFHYLIPPRLQLHPLDLLTRMAPLAFIQCVILSYFSGELEQVRIWSTKELTTWTAVALGLNGIIAFGLNLVSFTANKIAGPLSMTVAANVKQVLSIFLAVVIFDLSISGMNALGILLTLVGGAWYARVQYQEKKGRTQR
ncbi:triose-phosphate transporter family-domain-containing protein [Chiua virens]|nr:triose-phosphate transporter family-domain-containing protein [Chiua virens]